jgi:CHAT domain-containing protein
MDAQRPCPDSALLAAFLDGTLDGYERTAVVTHLTDCAQCRAVALTVVEFREISALDAQWEQPPAATSAPVMPSGALTWSRQKTRAPSPARITVVATAALALAIFYLVPYLVPASSPQPARAGVTEPRHRPLEARLSGAMAYAPPPSTGLSGGPIPRALPQLIAAAEVATAFHGDAVVLSRRSVGMAALLTGDLDDAIGRLEIAAAGDPNDVQASNDLAAAYYERSQRADRPDDLPAALGAVDRALRAAPSHLEALFNRALIFTALGLHAEARTAWQDYIDRDPQSPWTDEARERRDALQPMVSRPNWASIRRALDAAPGAREAESAVRHHASAVRDYLEIELLGRWLSAAKAGDRAAEDDALSRIALLGEAFATLATDHLYRDFVNAVHRTRAEAGVAPSLAPYEAYLEGLRLMAGQAYAAAAPVLRQAHRELVAVGSPLSVRAQIELAATHLYAWRFEAAHDTVAAAKQIARQRQHANLVTRAAWIEGLAAFGRNDFARAQIAYEEMLASAAATGDTDPWVMASVLLANLHDMLGNGPKAWQHRINGAARLDQVFSGTTRLNHLMSAAGDAHAGGHYGAALLFQSIVLSGQHAVPPNLAVQAHAQRARSLELLQRRAEARSALVTARRSLDNIGDPEGRGRVEADVLAAEAELWGVDDPTAASRAAQRALGLPIMRQDHLRRARVLLHLTAASMRGGHLVEAQHALDRGFDALDRFRSAPSAEFAIRASDPVWRLYEHAAQIALRRGDLAKAFFYIERRRLRTPQERRAWGGRTASLSQVQAALASDTALAVLTQFDDRLQIWVIRHDDVTTHSVAITAERGAALVATQLEEMRRSRARPPTSAQLFDAIVQPVSRLLEDAGRIVVVADAPYSRMAFAGLWDRRRDRFLVEDHGVVLAPNATAVVMAARGVRPAGRTVSPVYASVVTAEGRHAPSAGVTSLADSLTGVYGPDQVSRKSTATAAQLVSEVTTGDVVHVSAQVVANDDFPGLSHLQMVDEPDRQYSGALFGRNVANIRPRAQMIALERGPRGHITPRTEGAFGFARALLATGVSTVVSPVTDIEPASVARAWLDFHRHYAEGMAAVDSLRRAQLAALGASDRRSGPWATLTVFGSTR